MSNVIKNDDQEYIPKVSVKPSKINKDAVGYERAHTVKKDFDEAIQNKINDNLRIGDNLVKIMNEVVGVLSDKTLQEQKHPSSAKREDATITNLIDVIKQINFDALNSEVTDATDLDSGTMAIIAFMLKAFLKYRDRINNQEYMISELTKQLNLLKKDLGVI